MTSPKCPRISDSHSSLFKTDYTDSQIKIFHDKIASIINDFDIFQALHNIKELHNFITNQSDAIRLASEMPFLIKISRTAINMTIDKKNELRILNFIMNNNCSSNWYALLEFAFKLIASELSVEEATHLATHLNTIINHDNLYRKLFTLQKDFHVSYNT